MTTVVSLILALSESLWIRRLLFGPWRFGVRQLRAPLLCLALAKGCEGEALVWLKMDEESAYAKGQRVFDISTNAAKIRLPWFRL